MAIRFGCSCGRTFTVDDSKAGRSGRCPSCGAVFKIPTAPVFIKTDQYEDDAIGDPEGRSDSEQGSELKMGWTAYLVLLCGAAIIWGALATYKLVERDRQLVKALEQSKRKEGKEIPWVKPADGSMAKEAEAIRNKAQADAQKIVREAEAIRAEALDMRKREEESLHLLYLQLKKIDS